MELSSKSIATESPKVAFINRVTMTDLPYLFPLSNKGILTIKKKSFCPPPFRRKAEGHCFWFSVGRGAWRVVRGSEFLVGTLSPYSSHSFCPILLQLYRCFKDGLKMCM